MIFPREREKSELRSLCCIYCLNAYKIASNSKFNSLSNWNWFSKNCRILCLARLWSFSNGCINDNAIQHKWNYSLDASTEGSTEGSTEVGAMEASSSSSKGVEDRHAATKNTKPTFMTKSEMLKALLTNQQTIISKMNNAFYTQSSISKN